MSEHHIPDSDAEEARLQAVERYRIVDTPPDRMFDRIAGLAARVFSMPIATVSIVDRDRIWFVAVHGLDESVRQADRDRGLGSSAILGDTTYVVHDALADRRSADNRFVREHRIRFYAGAPIVTSDGHRLGTVAVMDTELHAASDQQLAMLDDLAAIVMEQLELRLTSLDAVRAERRLRAAAEYARADAQSDRDHAERDRDAARRDRNEAELDRDIAEHDRDLIEQYATVLQRTLLPPSLPTIDGLTLASHYHPASQRRVGGDFYDVFALGDNRWAFFIGDVEGHGAEAAAVTSLIRYTLRSAALHYRDPTHALDELNSVLLREVDPRRFCTVLFGSLGPRSDAQGFQLTVATGGHLPALLLDPSNGRVAQVRPRDGMLVGLLPDATFDACSVHLRPGQTLLFYTDGIVEARRGKTPFNEDSLAAFAIGRAALGAAALVDELAAMIPKLEPRDDVALLAIGAN